MSAFNTLIAGFSLGLGLILAIGAQNAFVLKQGIRKHHVFWICLCCAVSDALLIVAGVGGFASEALYPWIDPLTRYGGALFLLAYAVLSFKDAIYDESAMDYSAAEKPQSLRSALLVCLAFTWLNPHVYLDTLVLIGSVSTQYAEQRELFALGAVTASFVFFFSLGFGARYLGPLFAKPQAWRYLNIFVGCTMLAIATGLVL
ncbi:MAG: LysE/ArgO family amino acid transporter [Pseudomonadales bacterium]|nr:LysE/ArgO family amino acid transporter [Pseudomonadales bacterium]